MSICACFQNVIVGDFRVSFLGGPGPDAFAWTEPNPITAWGAGGDDSIATSGLADLLKGEAGHDSLAGGAGEDTVLGGSGRDRLHGDEGDDSLVGGAGADTAWGGSGRDTLLGGAGGDRLAGGAGDDLLDGGAGDDLLRGGGGADTLRFGPEGGRDRGIADAEDTVVIDAGAGGIRVEAVAGDRMAFTLLDAGGAEIGTVLLLANLVARLELHAEGEVVMALDAELRAHEIAITAGEVTIAPPLPGGGITLAAGEIWPG